MSAKEDYRARVIAAVEAVERKEYGVNEAARLFKVSPATISRHRRDENTNHTNGQRLMLQRIGAGRPTLLPPEVEATISEHAKEWHGRGFSLSKCQFNTMVVRVGLEILGPDNPTVAAWAANGGPGEKWYRNFFQRFPRLTHRKQDNLDHQRREVSPCFAALCWLCCGE